MKTLNELLEEINTLPPYDIDMSIIKRNYYIDKALCNNYVRMDLSIKDNLDRLENSLDNIKSKVIFNDRKFTISDLQMAYRYDKLHNDPDIISREYSDDTISKLQSVYKKYNNKFRLHDDSSRKYNLMANKILEAILILVI